MTELEKEMLAKLLKKACVLGGLYYYNNEVTYINIDEFEIDEQGDIILS